MKQQFLVILAAVLVLSLACIGCKKNDETTSSTDTAAATTDTTSTATAATDTSSTATPSSTGTTSTTSTGSTGGTASSLSDADKKFAEKFAQGGMSEVNLGTLASSKATSPDVKAFGDRMVTDHGKANDELKQLATNKGLSLPTDVDKEQKDTANKLEKKSGKDFDKSYIDEMVKDHEQDAKEFEKASKDAKDPDLKAFAAKTLTIVQDHLKMAKETQKKLK